jgi:hypothetical protein
MRTLVSAAHRNQQFSARGELKSEFLRLHALKVHPNFAHGFNDYRMDTFGGLCTGRQCTGMLWIRDTVEEGSRHLRTTGVLYAGEEKNPHYVLGFKA